MTTHYIKLSVGTSNVMTTSVTTMQIFMDIKQTLKAIKSHLIKGSLNNISYEIITRVRSSRDNFTKEL